MIATYKMASRPGRARSVRRHLSQWTARAIATVLQWAERRRQRHALLQLSDSMLKDIGLSRADMAREAEKPFWQP